MGWEDVAPLKRGESLKGRNLVYLLSDIKYSEIDNYIGKDYNIIHVGFTRIHFCSFDSDPLRHLMC